MKELPSLLELLKAGVHFGHKVSKRHPSMEPFIFGQRNGVHIFNLEKTREQLEKALTYMKAQVVNRKTILFVGSKRHVRPYIRQYAEACGMPFVPTRWIGGTMTNFSVVRKSIQKLVDLRARRDSGELEKKYTKKEQLEFQREIERLEEIFGGMESLTQPPDILFVWDIRTEETAMREARKRKIPIVAVCDTNVRATEVTHIIPANDDSIRTADLILSLVAEAIREGVNERPVIAPKQEEKKQPVRRAEKAPAKEEEQKKKE